MMRKFMIFLFFLPIFLLLWGDLSTPGASASDGIVGVEICKGCHEDRYQTYMLSRHAKKEIPGSPATQDGCESCHGPGAAHVEKSGEKGRGIFAFRKRGQSIEDTRAKSAKCLACHSQTKDLSFWDLGRHQTMGISCDNCHTLHTGTRKNLKASQPELCYACHQRVRAEADKQSHHPIREGRIKCTDCHDQHGGFGPRMIKADTVRDLCLKCHPEKRGPYMWPHPPVEENCLYCHLNHGSNHTKLLNSRLPQVCRNCHDASRHPSTIYTRFETFQGATPSTRMFARACLNCHVEIHGTNGPSVRGERLLR